MAAVVGVVCGAELVVAIVVGGAGVRALFGWEAVLVAGAVLLVLVTTVKPFWQRSRDDSGEVAGVVPKTGA